MQLKGICFYEIGNTYINIDYIVYIEEEKIRGNVVTNIKTIDGSIFVYDGSREEFIKKINNMLMMS